MTSSTTFILKLNKIMSRVIHSDYLSKSQRAALLQKKFSSPEISQHNRNLIQENNRVSELEQSQRNISTVLQQKNDYADNSVLHKLNLNIFISVATTLIICVVLVIFGRHFWEIPSQTQAVNDYIYSKIVTESPSQNLP